MFKALGLMLNTTITKRKEKTKKRKRKENYFNFVGCNIYLRSGVTVTDTVIYEGTATDPGLNQYIFYIIGHFRYRANNSD